MSVTAGHRSASAKAAGQGKVTVVDDLAVHGDDGDLLGADLDGGDNVLVRVLLGDGQSLPEQVEEAVGSDVADHFDAALGRQAGRHRL